jgi:hypothetical protein
MTVSYTRTQACHIIDQISGVNGHFDRLSHAVCICMIKMMFAKLASAYCSPDEAKLLINSHRLRCWHNLLRHLSLEKKFGRSLHVGGFISWSCTHASCSMPTTVTG